MQKISGVSSWLIFPNLSSQACKIIGGQRYTKGLTDKQITSLLKVTCQRPRDRETDILQVYLSNLLNYILLFWLTEKMELNIWTYLRYLFDLCFRKSSVIFHFSILESIYTHDCKKNVFDALQE